MSFIKEGFQFNGWTVLGPGKMTDSFKCQCQCGNEQELLYANILKGVRQNCGCENTKDQKPHPFYNTYLLQSEGIYDKNNRIGVMFQPNYREIKYYTAQPELRSFYEFYKVFGPTYFEGATLVITDRNSETLGINNMRWEIPAGC